MLAGDGRYPSLAVPLAEGDMLADFEDHAKGRDEAQPLHAPEFYDVQDRYAELGDTG